MSTDLPDGIYFSLPEDQYHALPRLSASGIKTLLVSPLQFYMESWMNPEREESDDTAARKLGRAYHKLILEGDDAFDAGYAVAPEKSDFPDALDGAAALKEKCADLGLKKTGTIPELCERIAYADPAVELWPVIKAAAMEEAAGREVLTRSQWQEIQRMRYVLQHMPTVRSGFTGGYPEVSILWTDTMTGVRLKARMDYLKPRGTVAGILDLKTFANVMEKPMELAAATEIQRNRYHVQPPVYFAAWEAGAAMWRERGAEAVTVCAGPEPSEAWLTEVFEARRPQFHFVFAKTGRVPDVVVREFAEFETYGGNTLQPTEYFRGARTQFRRGVALFRRYMRDVGPDAPWVTDYGVKTLADTDFAMWFVEQNLATGTDLEDAA